MLMYLMCVVSGGVVLIGVPCLSGTLFFHGGWGLAAVGGHDV